MIDSHKNKSALEGCLEILHLSCNGTKLVNSEHDHAASGSVVMVAAPLTAPICWGWKVRDGNQCLIPLVAHSFNVLLMLVGDYLAVFWPH